MYPVRKRSRRVALREFERNDLDAVQSWTGDPDVVRHIPLGPTTRSEARGYLRQLRREARARPRRVYTLGVVDRADDTLVGSVGLTVDSLHHRRAELGYVLRRERWGRGLAVEASRLMLDLAFDELGLHRVWAICDVGNPASARVLEKLGMIREGRLRADLRIGDEFRDAWLYAILDEDRPAATYA